MPITPPLFDSGSFSGLYSLFAKLLPSLGIQDLGQSRLTHDYTVTDPNMNWFTRGETRAYPLPHTALNPQLQGQVPSNVDPKAAPWTPGAALKSSEVSQTMTHENIHSVLNRLQPNWKEIDPNIPPQLRERARQMLQYKGYSGQEVDTNEATAWIGGKRPIMMSDEDRQNFLNSIVTSIKSQGQDTTLLERVLNPTALHSPQILSER